MGNVLNEKIKENLGRGFNKEYGAKIEKIKLKPFKLVYISQLSEKEKSKLNLSDLKENQLICVPNTDVNFVTISDSYSDNFERIILPSTENISLLTKINKYLFERKNINFSENEHKNLISKFYLSIIQNIFMLNQICIHQELIKAVFASDSFLTWDYFRILSKLFELQYKQDSNYKIYRTNNNIDAPELRKQVEMNKDKFYKKLKRLKEEGLIIVDVESYKKERSSKHYGGPLTMKKADSTKEELGFLVFDYNKFAEKFNTKFEIYYNLLKNKPIDLIYPPGTFIAPLFTIKKLKNNKTN